MKAHLWSAAIWSCVFVHSLFTQMETTVWARVAPLVCLIGLVVILSGFMVQTPSKLSEHLLLNAWLCLVTLGLILRTASVIDDVALGTGIAAMTLLASVVWCIVSRVYSVSEGGWHWYVWSMTIVLTLCAASIGAPHDDPLLTMYGIAAGIVVIANALYWWRILRQDAHNAERCQLLWRTCAAAVGTLSFLILAILHADSTIEQDTWQTAILVLEGYALAVIGVDAFVPRLAYTPISTATEDEEPDV